MKSAAMRFFCMLMTAMALVAVAGLDGETAAQTSKKSLFKGTQPSKGVPVRIQAASLEVRDKEKTATFSGNVHLVQGETDVRCSVLVVYYEGQLGTAAASATAKTASSKGGKSQIRRMEATGNVIVIQKDQRASGDRGDFDMHANTVTLTGNVVVTRGVDVLRGQRLVVHLNTGVYHMESGGGRVEMLVLPNQGKKSEEGARPKREGRGKREERRSRRQQQSQPTQLLPQPK